MPSLYNIKISNNTASVKDVDGKKGIVTGYFSAFNNVDSDGDIIRPGAFTKTISENMNRIKHLFNHNPSQPLGKLIELKEDNTGLYYESQIGTHTLGVDFIKMVESGLITEHSIGFKTLKSNPVKNKDGVNEITEIKLWEGSSLSSWGANELTPVTALKSGTAIEDLITRQKNLEKFCRNSSASDETIELLLLETKQLTQIIIEISEKSTKPEHSTLPGEEIKAAIHQAFKPIHSQFN